MNTPKENIDNTKETKKYGNLQTNNYGVRNQYQDKEHKKKID